MNKGLQKIFNNSLMYAIGTIASKAVGFFLIPIYTYNMSSNEYGIATTITSFVSSFGIVVMLSLQSAMIRFYNQYSEKERQRFVGTVVTFVLGHAIWICVLLILLKDFYMKYLFRDIVFFPCVFWGILSLGTESVYLLYQSLLQARQEGAKYSLNSIVYLFFHIVTVIVFVLFMKLRAEGVILAMFITNTVFAIYGLFSMYRNKYMVWALDKVMLLRSLKYSLSILPHDFFAYLNVYVVKIMVNNFLNYTWSGMFTLASQFASILSLVQISVNLAFRPWFIEQMDKGEEGRKQIKYMSCMSVALLSFCATGVSLFSKEIIMIMTDSNYLNVWILVPALVYSQLIASIYYSHVQTLMYSIKMSRYTVVCSLVGLLSNVIVSCSLMYCFEQKIIAILLGQIISQILMSAMTVIFSNRAENVDFGLKKMILNLLCTLIFICTGILLTVSIENFILTIGLKIVFLILAFGIFLGKYRKDFVLLLKGLLDTKLYNKAE